MAAPPRPLSGTDPSGLVNTTKSPRLITKPKEARVSTALLLCHKLGREEGKHGRNVAASLFRLPGKC